MNILIIIGVALLIPSLHLHLYSSHMCRKPTTCMGAIAESSFILFTHGRDIPFHIWQQPLLKLTFLKWRTFGLALLLHLVAALLLPCHIWWKPFFPQQYYKHREASIDVSWFILCARGLQLGVRRMDLWSEGSVEWLI